MGEPPAEPQQFYSEINNEERLDAVETLFLHIYRHLPYQIRNFIEKSVALIQQNRRFQKLNTLQVSFEIMRNFVNTGCASWLTDLMWPWLVEWRERSVDGQCVSYSPCSFFSGFSLGVFHNFLAVYIPFVPPLFRSKNGQNSPTFSDKIVNTLIHLSVPFLLLHTLPRYVARRFQQSSEMLPQFRYDSPVRTVLSGETPSLTVANTIRGSFALFQGFFSALSLWEKVVPPSRSNISLSYDRSSDSKTHWKDIENAIINFMQYKRISQNYQYPQQQQQQQQLLFDMNSEIMKSALAQYISERTVSRIFKLLPYLLRFFTVNAHFYYITKYQSGGFGGTLAYFGLATFCFLAFPWP
jgi:hypothetical protein